MQHILTTGEGHLLTVEIRETVCDITCILEGILALRATLDYVPPEEPLGTPLGNTVRIRQPKLDWRGP